MNPLASLSLGSVMAFLRSKTGMFLIFFSLLLIFAFVLQEFRMKNSAAQEGSPMPKPQNGSEASPLSEVIADYGLADPGAMSMQVVIDEEVADAQEAPLTIIRRNMKEFELPAKSMVPPSPEPPAESKASANSWRERFSGESSEPYQRPTTPKDDRPRPQFRLSHSYTGSGPVTDTAEMGSARGSISDRTVQQAQAIGLGARLSNAGSPSSEGEDRPLEEQDYAPFGRLLKCELLGTVDSFDEAAPIIGIVVEDLYWEGRLVVPANSEVHGLSKVDLIRDRIKSHPEWTLVLPQQGHRRDGRELLVTGMILHREEYTSAETEYWGVNDMSPGLQGYVIRESGWEEIKMFAAAALSAFSQSLKEKSVSHTGYEYDRRSVENAGLSSSSEVLDRYARRIEDEIRENGAYIRVPAGTQFYLYLRQTLVNDEAKVAASRSQQVPRSVEKVSEIPVSLTNPSTFQQR